MQLLIYSNLSNKLRSCFGCHQLADFCVSGFRVLSRFCFFSAWFMLVALTFGNVLRADVQFVSFFPNILIFLEFHRNSSAGDDICRTALGCLHVPKTRRFDSTKFSETTPFASAAALSEKGRLDSTKCSEGCRFRKVCALEPLRAQQMQTAKSGSIAPTEIWRHSTAFSENDDSKGRFDSTRYSGGCRFRKFGCYGTAGVFT